MTTNVSIETTMGTFVVELYTEHAPKTCENFASLSRRGYYDGTVFHRIIADFMAQGGDPSGTGRGGESIYGPTFADEIPLSRPTNPSSKPVPLLRHTGAGVLSMANSGRDTNGSQFFVTLAPTPWLDGKHTVFGRVRSGMGVVKRLGMVRTGADDRPLDEVRIVKASVVEGADGQDA